MSPQTVTFPCPFCGRRMGVPAELIGKQVRCPHCKQVVLAPLNVAPSGIVPAVNLPPPPPLSMVGPNAPTQAISAPGAPPAPAPESDLPTFALQQREGADSILSGPGESEDEVFSQPGGGRLPAVPPLDLTSPIAPTQPTAADDNPFEIAGTAPTAPAAGTGPRANPPAATSELPNPFLELEPVTLPAAFQPAAPPPGRPPQVYAPPFQPPPAPPRAAFPTPAAFPSAPLPAPAANPFAGIDDPTVRPLPGPAPIPLPLPATNPEATTDALDDQPRKRRRSRREEEDAPPAKAEEKPQRGSRSRAALPPSSGASNILLFVAIGYGVLVTGLAAWALFLKGPTLPPEHPLSTIPDNFGEFEPGQRKKTSQGSYYRFNVDGDLPPAQRAAIGATVTVGKMEVTPLRVERRPLVIKTEYTNKPELTEPTKTEALVLTLSIKNTSDLTFHPMDPAFTRRANEGKKDFPITRVVVDKKKFYAGGAIDWPTDPNRVKRIYETQQLNDNVPLGPSQTREYVVFTDAKNTQIMSAVMGARESVQWRVEVRRAPVEIGGKELPVTAIVGVDFKPGDVKPADLK